MGTCEFSMLCIVALTVMLAQEKSVPVMACHATVLSGMRVVVAVADAMRMARLYWLGILLKQNTVQWQ